MTSTDKQKPSHPNKYPHKYTDWGFNRLEEVSRTFALSIQYLPTPMKTYVSTAYLLCRIPDTIEDSPNLTPRQKEKALAAFETVLMKQTNINKFLEILHNTIQASDIEESPDWDLVYDSAKAYELFESFPENIQNAMRPWLLELTQGMRLFVTRYRALDGIRIDSYSELDEYCYYVAGTVGHLLTDVIGEQYEIEIPDSIHQDAEEYGLVLQYINIAKDVFDDYETENNIYLPLKELAIVGVDADTITNIENQDSVGSVVYDVVTKAEEYAPAAHRFLNWLHNIDEQNFESLAIPYLLAVATMRELKDNTDLATKPKEVKITRDEVISIIAELTTDSQSIEQFADRIQDGELQ